MPVNLSDRWRSYTTMILKSMENRKTLASLSVTRFTAVIQNGSNVSTQRRAGSSEL
jgi:hypothetical protein